MIRLLVGWRWYCLQHPHLLLLIGLAAQADDRHGLLHSDAIRTSAIISLGGIVAGSLLGWTAPRLGLRRLVIAAMIVTTITMGAFGDLTQLHQIQLFAAFVGIGIFGGVVGL